jgi:hypothetical protein
MNKGRVVVNSVLVTSGILVPFVWHFAVAAAAEADTGLLPLCIRLKYTASFVSFSRYRLLRFVRIIMGNSQFLISGRNGGYILEFDVVQAQRVL